MDRELAAALAGELPAAANIKVDTAMPVSLSCPARTRGAMFTLPDGQISVLLLPVGTSMAFDSSAGGANASAPTSSGFTVVVVSAPAESGGQAPYVSDLSRFARAIAEIY